jgi:hypothetical protein
MADIKKVMGADGVAPVLPTRRIWGSPVRGTREGGEIPQFGA